MTLLFTYLILALVVSFFCSIAEAVLLSVRPSYLASLEQEGNKGVLALKRLRENLDRPLSAILTMNTIAHTVGAAGVGAQAALVFGSDSIAITSAILTLLILVLSEIIPKTLGAVYWRELAPTFGILIEWLTRILLPFVWMSEKLTRFLSRSSASAYTFSRDEMEAMAEIGAKEGLLESKEVKIVQNLMRLHSLSVRDIMTPRPVIFSVLAKMTVGEFFSKHSEKPFSRIPIYGFNADDVIGYVLRTDLLIAQAKDEFDRTLSEFRRDFIMIPDMLWPPIPWTGSCTRRAISRSRWTNMERCKGSSRWRTSSKPSSAWRSPTSWTRSRTCSCWRTSAGGIAWKRSGSTRIALSSRARTPDAREGCGSFARRNACPHADRGTFQGEIRWWLRYNRLRPAGPASKPNQEHHLSTASRVQGIWLACRRQT
jgi:hypothetical protein